MTFDLKAYRHRLQLAQTGLADLLDISKAKVRGWERGEPISEEGLALLRFTEKTIATEAQAAPHVMHTTSETALDYHNIPEKGDDVLSDLLADLERLGDGGLDRLVSDLERLNSQT